MVNKNFTRDPLISGSPAPHSTTTPMDGPDRDPPLTSPSRTHQVPIVESPEEQIFSSMLHDEAQIVGSISPALDLDFVDCRGAGIWETENDDGGVIAMKLRDVDGMVDDKNIDFMCPTIVTIGEFMNDVSSRFGLAPNTFSIVYQSPTSQCYELSNMRPDDRFSVIGIHPSREKTYSLCLMKKRKAARKTKHVVRNLSKEFDVNFPDQNEPIVEKDTCVVEPMVIELSAVNECTGDFDEPFRKEFVGLKNRQQTCYLNSLIQSLFFCPEFRNCIYSQEVPYDPERKSIITAFQKMFLQLQFSVRSSIGTEELTRTFGWKEDHNFIQHDIEELYRAVMDLLGDEFKRMGKPSHGDSLFGGIMNDYVECLRCHTKNSKLELSLALSLPIRAFGQRLAEPTIEEALRHFIQFEVMNGENRYKCDKCQILADAHKGISFHTLPYLFCVQLRRWDYDFTSLTRRKVNDKVKFPFVLNMNEFVANKNEEPNESTVNLVPPIDPQQIGSYFAKGLSERTSHSRPAANPRGSQSQNHALLVSKPYGYQQEIIRYLAEGPNVYQLLAVWVHEGGSSHRGHYFAYVFDLEKNDWYLCNDSIVRKSSEADIINTQGGTSEEDDKGQAYMLIYRKCDERLNSFPMTLDELPPHLKDVWESMEEGDRKQNETEIYEKRLLRIRVFMRDINSWDVDCRDVVIHKNDSMKEAAMKAYQVFNPTHYPEWIRFVRFNSDYLICEESYDNRDDETFGSVFRRPVDDGREALMIEIATPERPFQPYAVTDAVCRTRYVNFQSGRLLAEAEIHVPHGGTVTSTDELREKIAKTFNIPTHSLFIVSRIMKEGINIPLDDPSATLKSFVNGARCIELMVQNVHSKDEDKFLDFMSEFFGSYNFYVDCQLPLLSTSDVIELDVNPHEVSNGEMKDLDVEPQFDFDPLDMVQVVDNKSEEGNLNRDFSDNSTSEESLTGSEVTIVGYETLANSPDILDIDESSEDLEKLMATSRSSKAQRKSPVNGQCKQDLDDDDDDESVSQNGFCENKPGSFFRVVSRTRYALGWERIYLRVSRAMTLSEMCKKLGKQINVDEFVLYGVSGQSEVEYTYHQSYRLEQLDRFDFMKTRLGRRLKKDERRVSLYLLDFATYMTPTRYLTEVILNSHMSGKEIKKQCWMELSNVPGLDFSPQFFRIRKKKGTVPSRIIRDYTKFRDIFLTNEVELYAQRVQTSKDPAENQHMIIIRHWCPSRMMLGEPYEIMVVDKKPEVKMKDVLWKATGIHPDNLEYIMPDPDVEYPFHMNPIVLQEKLTWSHFRSTLVTRLFVTYTDQCVIIIRDCTEIPREYTEEERLDYARNYMEYSVSPRKGETGLCINLARTPPA